MKLNTYLLRLYPRLWRERYEEEMLALLEQHPLSFRDSLDLCLGALDASLHPPLGTTGLSRSDRTVQLVATLRRAVLTIFCAWVCFLLAGWGFEKMTEDAQVQAVAHAHSVVGISFILFVLGGGIAVLAMVVGGLPIVLTVIRSALARRQGGPLILLTVPMLAGVVFWLTTWLLGANDQPGIQQLWPLLHHKGLFWVTLLTAAIASPAAVCFAVVRSEISEQVLRFAVFPSVLAALAMGLSLASTILWGIGLQASAPHLFTGDAGLLRSSTTGTWLGIVSVMALATLLTGFFLLRACSVRSALRNAAV